MLCQSINNYELSKNTIIYNMLIMIKKVYVSWIWDCNCVNLRALLSLPLQKSHLLYVLYY